MIGLQARRLDRWMEEKGGVRTVAQANHRVYEFGGAGSGKKLDIFEPQTFEEKPHKEGTINGTKVLLVTTRGILAGKLVGRGLRSPVRDLYDIAVAQQLDQKALKAAVEELEGVEGLGNAEDVLKSWEAEKDAIKEEAREMLEGVPEEYRHIKEDPVRYATEAIKEAKGMSRGNRSKEATQVEPQKGQKERRRGENAPQLPEKQAPGETGKERRGEARVGEKSEEEGRHWRS